MEPLNEILTEVRESLLREDYGAAIETLEQALEKAPDDAAVHDLMAGVYYLQGNHGAALPHAQRATKLAPNVAEYQKGEGTILAALNQNDAAIGKLSRAVELEPTDVDALNNLAAVMLRAGQPDRAEAYLREAIKIAPQATNAIFNLGIALARQKNLLEAERQFRTVLERIPDHVETLFELGRLLYERNRLTEAEAALRKGLLKNPDFADILILLGRICGRRGANEEGEALLQRAAARGRKRQRVYEYLGFLYLEWGKRPKALAAFKRAFAANPHAVGTLAGLSHYPPDDLGIDLTRAIDHALAALSPNDMDSRNLLEFSKARALDQAQDHDKAWAQAVEANAHYVAAHDLKTHPIPDTQKLRQSDSSPVIGIATPTYVRSKETIPSVFIAGMPRSGKSTAEKLIGNIAGVRLGYESNILPEVIDDLNARIGFELVTNPDDLPDSYISLFQEIYQEKLHERAASYAAITNTVSSTYVLNSISKILTAVPRSCFVITDRDLWDNALRIFFFHYRLGTASYTYRLSSIIRQIEIWRTVIDKWSKDTPQRFLVLKYEELIGDPESALFRICNFCDLPFPDRPLAPLFDDRGCAAPYRDMMKSCLEAENPQT